MNPDLKALQQELSLVRVELNQRLDKVEHRLEQLATAGDVAAVSSLLEISSETTAADVHHAPLADSAISAPAETPRKESAQPEPKALSYLTVLLLTLLENLFDWFSPLKTLYQSYQERGMLGLFSLTLVGIALTLAGFGYLMQLVIDQMGAGTKSLLFTTLAISVVSTGIVLRARTPWVEFATAIVALGLLLAYSTVYYAGSVYSLLPDLVVLILYLAIAMSCHALANWLETKVIAGLGIIGIATMPILSGSVEMSAFLYLISLALVVLSGLILSYRKAGHGLASLSLAFTLVALTWVMAHEPVSAWLIDLFYLLFFGYCTCCLFFQRFDSKPVLILLASSVGAILVVLLQTGSLISEEMSACFVLNAVIAAALAYGFYQVKQPQTHLLILLASLWLVLAIVSAVSTAYWGIAWAVEGVLLIVMGRQMRICAVVNQGQLLTAIALLYCFAALAPYFPSPALRTMDGWVLCLVIVAVMASWQRLICAENEGFDALTLNKIKPLLTLLEVIWLSALALLSADLWLNEWTGGLVLCVQVAVLFRAKACRQTGMEAFAALLIVIPLFYAGMGAWEVASVRFMLLPWYAKLSLLSVVVQLWLWAEFYRRFHPQSVLKATAEFFRIVFYMLLPVCWLGAAVRHLQESSVMILWLSPLLALGLTHFFRHPLLRMQTQVLTVVMALIMTLAMTQVSLNTGLIALLGFGLFYAVAYAMERAGHSVALTRFLCSVGLLNVGLALPLLVANTANVLLGWMLVSVYWGIVWNRVAYSKHFKRNQLLITLLNLVWVLCSWFLCLENPAYALIPCVFLLAALYQKERCFKRSALALAMGRHSDLLLHTVAAITYGLFFMSWPSARFDLLMAPMLAAHGALILFLKDKRSSTVKYSFALIALGIAKLAIVDVANAMLWQKVALFMGIGVFILLAAFWYQKKVKQPQAIR